MDTYTVAILKEQYTLHKHYVVQRMNSAKNLGIKFRLPCIPEDISENLIKFIIHKNGDTTSSWNCKGDLTSSIENIQECKCFTSVGPLSFSPTGDWDAIYFLDATNWLNDTFILYKFNIKKTSNEWKNIMVNKKETFEDQCNQKRRPRLGWDALFLQLQPFCVKIFDGHINEIFGESLI
jgi:hypothetical protein